MIEFLKGVLAHKSPTFVVIETSGGVAYRVNISLNTYSKIGEATTLRLWTVLQIREDAHTLFGFFEESERVVFNHLVSVSGVGAATAQVVLSSLSADEIRSAILSDNEGVFGRVKGIGPKTAKRIILDLKDKMKKDGGDLTNVSMLNISSQGNKLRDEALSAMLALGFQRIPVQKALNQILQSQPNIVSVEELIKQALRQMS
ncbi:MAG: hypothetical protein RL757_109 [Bacteroidota bacterium]|jgi:Holliday junction DNA helicase RuvA